MTRTSLLPYYAMGSLIVICLLVTTTAGLLMQGIYRPFIRSELLLAGAVVQDAVSLIVAVLLVGAMYFTWRGAHRAFVIWTGLLVYVVYYYAFYAFARVYTPYYPLYLALIGLSTYSLVGMLTGVDQEVFKQRGEKGMPVRFIAVVLAIPVLFVPLWLSMIAQGISTQKAPDIGTVFVLDLSFLIPGMAFTAVQVWRRCPVGYLLSGPLLVKAALSGILLTVGSAVQSQLGFEVAFEELGMYIFLAVAGSVALLLYLRNLRDNSI